MMGEAPSQDPLAVLVSEHQHWPEPFWPGPSLQNQLPELMTEPRRNNTNIRLCSHVPGEDRRIEIGLPELHGRSLCYWSH